MKSCITLVAGGNDGDLTNFFEDMVDGVVENLEDKYLNLFHSNNLPVLEGNFFVYQLNVLLINVNKFM